MKLTREERRAFLLEGVKARIKELQQELARLQKIATPVADASESTAKPVRKLTAAQRKTLSKAMKLMWKQKRAEKETA